MKKNLLLLYLLLICSIGFAQKPFDLDQSFKVDMNGYLNDYREDIRDMVIEDNGKITIVGNFKHWYFSEMPSYFARLNPDGSLDNGFLGLDLQLNYVPGCITRAYGSYYIGLSLWPGIIKLDSNGVLDNSFTYPWDTVFDLDNVVKEIYVYPNGSVLAAGVMSDIMQPNTALLKFNPDGSLDSSFTLTYANNGIYSMEVLSDGRILCAGDMFDDAGTRRCLWRVNANGTLDSSFNTGAVSGYCSSFEVLGNGKILACGEIDIPGYPGPLGLLRLNEDGSVDNSFNYGNYFTHINCFLVQGAYILVGTHNGSVNNQPFNCLVAFDTLGNLDNSYFGTFGPNPTTFFSSNNVSKLELQGDKILVFGHFNLFDNFPTFSAARLYGISVGIEEKTEDAPGFDIFPNPAIDYVNVSFNDAFAGTIDILDLSGRIVRVERVKTPMKMHRVNLPGFCGGVYLFRVRNADGILSTQKKIVVMK